MLLSTDFCPDLTVGPLGAGSAVTRADRALSVPLARRVCSPIGSRFRGHTHDFDLCTSVRAVRTSQTSRKLYSLLIHRYLCENLPK